MQYRVHLRIRLGQVVREPDEVVEGAEEQTSISVGHLELARLLAT